MRQNPHVRICGGPGSATTLVYPTIGHRGGRAAGLPSRCSSRSCSARQSVLMQPLRDRLPPWRFDHPASTRSMS